MKWFLNLGKNSLITAFFAIAVIALAQCSSSDSGDGDATPAATAEDDDTAAASGASSAIGSVVSGTGGGVSGSESVALRIKAMVANGIKAQSMEFDETITIPCTDGGSISNAASGTITVDSDTGEVTLDLTSTATFDACAESGSVALEDGSICDFNFEMDGEFTCDLAGSASSETDFEMTMECSTASECDGVTITINGTEHTMGMSMTGSMSGTDTEPTLTGEICIDGESFDMDDLEDATVADDALTCS